MIDLYAAGTSNGMRARIALEECGLAYKLHPIALEKGEQKSAQFTALNPNAQIPVIVDHEGPGGKPVTVSQSSAILIYAGEKSGKYIPKDAAARPAFWQALMSASTDMTPTLGSIFQIVRGKDPHGVAIRTALFISVISLSPEAGCRPSCSKTACCCRLSDSVM